MLSDYLQEKGIRTKYTSPKKNDNAIIKVRPVNTPNIQKIEFFKQRNTHTPERNRYNPSKFRLTPQYGQRKKKLPTMAQTIDNNEKYFSNLMDPKYEMKSEVFKIDVKSVNLLRIQERNV